MAHWHSVKVVTPVRPTIRPAGGAHGSAPAPRPWAPSAARSGNAARPSAPKAVIAPKVAPASYATTVRLQPSAAKAPSSAASSTVTQPAAKPEVEVGSATLQMRNFPPSWTSATASTQFPAKLSHLLGRFGPLKENPVISRTASGVVAVATFEKRDNAERAVSMLHGVDNRTEAEKRGAGGRPAKETEKFHVELIDEVVGNDMKGRADAEEQLVQICLSRTPPEWTVADIQELCSQYGSVDTVTEGVAGSFIISFSSADAASEACEALHGMEHHGESESMVCELLEANDASEDAATPSVAPSSAVQAPSAGKGSVGAREVPLAFYVDELQRSSMEPGPEDREIFLRDLPTEDYTEEQLREWLDDFGSVEAAVFIKDLNSKKLTGSGYVRFSTKEEADGLLAAFGETEEGDGNVKGHWSLSEQLLKGKAGPLKVDCVPAIRQKLRSMQQDLHVKTLHFLGSLSGADPTSPAGLQTFGLEGGPLHIVCSPAHRFEDAEALRGHLAKALAKELSGDFSAQPTPTAVAPGAGTKQQRQTKSAPDRPNAVQQPKAGQVRDKPCIVVQGFPPSWQEQQARLVFAVFGGVSSVEFGEDEEGARLARVELKHVENMEKAVDQLHGTQVGDGELIEECTITCRVEGGLPNAFGKQWPIFVDELPMPKRPDVRPRQSDREVFLHSLPVRDCTEDQIRAWLESFGGVEDMLLLQEKLSGKPNGKGYVRFNNHHEAAACVEAQTSIADAEEGDVVAQWSESERALQMHQSVYAADVHSAFTQQALDTVKRQSKVESLWILSERQHPPPGAPKRQAKYLHFIAGCREDQVSEVRSLLSKFLETFHQGVTRSLQKGSASAGPSKRGREEEKPAAAECSGPPPGQWTSQMASAQPAWPPQGSWQAQAPWGARPPPPGYPDPRWGVPPGYPPVAVGGKGVPGPAPGPCWGHPGWPHPPERATHAVPERSSAKPAAEEAAAAERDKDVHAKVERGEALIKEAKALSEQSSTAKKAYEKYCKGLQKLVEVMQKLPEDDAEGQRLRMRVDGYLEEAERLKEKVNPESSSHKSGGKSAEAPPDHRGRSRTRDARRKFDPDALARLDKGDALLKEGEQLEERGRIEEAYEKYTRGLQYLLEVIPKMEKADPSDPQVTPLRGKVKTYLERAERLKERLENGGGRESRRSQQGKDPERDRRAARNDSTAPPRSHSRRHRSEDMKEKDHRPGASTETRRRSHDERDGRRESGHHVGLRSRSRTCRSAPRGLRERGDHHSRDQSDRGRDGYRDLQRGDSRGRAMLHSPPRDIDDGGDAKATRSKAPGAPPVHLSRPPPPSAPLLRPKAGAGLGKAPVPYRRPS